MRGKVNIVAISNSFRHKPEPMKVLLNQTQRGDNFYMSAWEHITDIKLVLVAR